MRPKQRPTRHTDSHNNKKDCEEVERGESIVRAHTQPLILHWAASAARLQPFVVNRTKEKKRRL